MTTFLRLTLIALIFSAAVHVCAERQTIHLYVAPSGNDSNPGTEARQFATISRARDAIRALKKEKGLSTPVTVLLREGTYFPTEPLRFTEEDSGSEDCPIIYMAYPGEAPILTGGIPITGFKPYKGDIVCANLPKELENAYFRSLFVDGERMIRARYPNYVPDDPYRQGFLYVRPACFGVAVGAAHNPGDWLEWEMDVPTSGEYAAWALYAHGMKKLGREDMAGQTSLTLDGGVKTVLTNLPDTGGWHNYKWAKTATLTLNAGRHTLRWINDKGGGINFDVFAFTDDPDWTPTDWRLPAVSQGKHLVIVQAEDYMASHGLQIVKCGGLSCSSKTEFPFLPGQVKPTWAKEPDAEVHIWPSSPRSCRAFNEILKLERIDEEKGLVVVSGKEAAVEICSGDRYFVENIFEELDSPGEWYLDSKARKVYLWPKKPLTPASQVIAPRLTRMVEFDGEEDKPVQHIRLCGITLQETDYTPEDGFVAYGSNKDGVVTLRYANHITIENCRLKNIGKAGIHSSFGQNNRFIGNEISHGAEGGIYVTNSPAGTVISDNHIHHLGWVYKHVAGISTREQVHGALIAHNHIHDCTRWGISVNHTTSTNNIVEYNHLHDLNTETYDTGGLEVTQHSRDHRSGSIFRYNLIHDTGGYSSMMGQDLWNSWGIYLDSFAGGFTVHHNVVYGAYDGGLMIQGGKDNKVFNNIFAENGPRRQILIANFSDNSRGTEFHHNIVYFTAPDSVAIYCGRKAVHTVTRWDYNLYWHDGMEIRVFAPGDEPYAQWFRPFDFWRNSGFDKQSIIADPQFVDPKKHDYRLKPDSPAFKFGFEPIPIEKIGRRAK